MVVTVSYFNVHFSSLRLAFEKSDSLRGIESPLLQEGQGGGFPFSSLRPSSVGSDAGRAMSAGS